MTKDDDWEKLYKEKLLPPGIEVHDRSKEVTWPEGKVVPDSSLADQWQQMVDRRRESDTLMGRIVVTMIATTAAFGAGATLGVAFATSHLGLVALVGLGFVAIVVLLVILSIVWLVDD
jgi:hypothetical protein